MRLQHVIMAGLVFLVSFGILANIASQLEQSWGVNSTDLYNDTETNNVSSIISTMNIFNQEQQYVINNSQYMPGGSSVETPESGTTNSISSSSFTMAVKFAQQALTLPKKIVLTMGGYLGIDPQFMWLTIIWITLIIAFILVSSVFFNKL